jgi:hypothetical protein
MTSLRWCSTFSLVLASITLYVAFILTLCDSKVMVCLVRLSLTVGIFSPPPFIFDPHLFTRTALFLLIPLWACFYLYCFTLRVPLLSPLCPLWVFVWCLLGVLLGCVRGRRPVDVAYALLIFILVILWVNPISKVYQNFCSSCAVHKTY